MGYNLHITRKEDWFDESNDKDISLEEWTEYANADPELRVGGFIMIKTTDTDGTIKNEKIDVYTWTAHSKIKNDTGGIYYDHGNITAKNPNTEFIDKMKLIAQNLHSKVVGDEGESY